MSKTMVGDCILPSVHRIVLFFGPQRYLLRVELLLFTPAINLLGVVRRETGMPLLRLIWSASVSDLFRPSKSMPLCAGIGVLPTIHLKVAEITCRTVFCFNRTTSISIRVRSRISEHRLRKHRNGSRL